MVLWGTLGFPSVYLLSGRSSGRWLSYVPGHSRLAGFHEGANHCNQKTYPPQNQLLREQER